MSNNSDRRLHSPADSGLLGVARRMQYRLKSEIPRTQGGVGRGGGMGGREGGSFDNYSTTRDCAHRGRQGPICPGAGGFDNRIRALSILSIKGDNNMHAPPFLRFACLPHAACATGPSRPKLYPTPTPHPPSLPQLSPPFLSK